MKKTITLQLNYSRKLAWGRASLVFSVGFLVVVGALFLGNKFSDKTFAASYKFNIYDEVKVDSNIAKLDVWSDAAVPDKTVIGTKNPGDQGSVMSWLKIENVIGAAHYYWKIKWSDGLIGWSEEIYLEKAPLAGGGSVYKIGDWVLTKDTVNLRFKPSILGGIYRTIDPGIKCQIKNGPTVADGYNWWGVTCNIPKISNMLVYIAEGNWLEKTTPPAPNQPPVISGVLGPTTLEVYEGGFWTWNVMDSEGDAYTCNKTKWGDGVEDYEDSHYYIQMGSYTITFNCQDARGAVGSATASVTVTPSTTGNPPGGATIGGKAFFKPIITGSLTLSSNQDGQWSLSVIGSGISLTFMVDWGDGSKDSYTPDVAANGSMKIAAHKYNAPGIYNIKFTATDNISGVKGTVMTSVGVLDPAMIAKFVVGTKLRTKEAVTVMQMLGSKDPATNQSYLGPAPDFVPIPELGPRPKYAIGKVSDEIMPNTPKVRPLEFWGQDWWVRVAFPGWETGWVKESQLEEMCPALSAAQLSSQNRFAEGECVWVLGSLASNLSVRGSVPVSGYPFYGDPSPLGTVKGGNQGVLVSGPTATNDFVWWQVSWDNGLRGWSAGNWIASERSKPKSTGGVFTPNSTTTIYFSPQGGRVVGQPVDPNGSIVGRWWANTTGTIGWPEFVGGKWWYKVTYTPPSMPTLRGWSGEDDLFGAGTPGNDVPVTVPTCEAKFIPGDRVTVLAPGDLMPFSQSEPPGRNLVGIQSLNGSLGTVNSGPQLQNSICWWGIKYDNSSYPSLWTDANYLQVLGNAATSTSGQRAGLTDIVVDSPRSGEVYRVGDTLMVRWGTPLGVTKIHIYLTGVGPIAFNAPNTGSYDWIIPATLNGQSLEGGNFVAQVFAADSNMTFNAKSPAFSVISGDVSGGSGFRRGCTIRTTDNLNVRSSASIPGGDPFANVVGTIPMGIQGVIDDGPTTAVGYTWWHVDFPGALDGWSVDVYFQRVSCP